MARFRFLAHAAGVVTVAAALLTAVFTSPASACSCLPSTEGERYQRATHVFSGLVLSQALEAGDPSSPYDDEYRYAVAVHREYKGDVPVRVDVVTSTSGGLCGISLRVGTRYLVFASGDSSDGRVETHLCSGTRLASAGPPVTTVSSASTHALRHRHAVTGVPCAGGHPDGWSSAHGRQVHRPRSLLRHRFGKPKKSDVCDGRETGMWTRNGKRDAGRAGLPVVFGLRADVVDTAEVQPDVGR
ncbi:MULTISPECIES: hypothetical protein [Saccharothrix]|uniref:hypothetical protein n=1 Tax=Saccharothrix TaxID=2071 RepID=UPI0009FA6B3A|nr:hypothetical protein [Saccharothrix sp. CB00851]